MEPATTIKPNTLINNRPYYDIVQVADKSQVFRRFEVDKDTKLYFPYLQAGKYSFRITEDRNRNGIFDTGNLPAGVSCEIKS